MYSKEGRDIPDCFIEVWKTIHPYKGYNPDEIVWVHDFIKYNDWKDEQRHLETEALFGDI